ncbi:MAG: hypothetical protein ACLTPR_13250 [Enterococcus canintestini]|uniref:hypothetical protein n=1 Tax=Enterococcus canintestini TaxID=317010 RepID=UPI0039950E5F
MKQTKTKKEKQCKTFTPRNEFEARLFKRFESYAANQTADKNNTISYKQEQTK